MLMRKEQSSAHYQQNLHVGYAKQLINTFWIWLFGNYIQQSCHLIHKDE